MSMFTHANWDQATTSELLDILREMDRARKEIEHVLEERHLPEAEARKLLGNLEWETEEKTP